MLTSATVENFRGIERLHVEGLGRVNLIIGRNDSGKTALMEALEMLRLPEDAGMVLMSLQLLRHPDANVEDFDDFWLPVFRKMDAARGFHAEGANERGEQVELSMSKVSARPQAIPSGIDSLIGAKKSWALKWNFTRGTRGEHSIAFDGTKLEVPRLISASGSGWMGPSPRIGAADVQALSRMKQQGRGGTVVDLLRLINARVSGIELLAPTGERAAVFVDLEHDGLLPLSMMGEGAKRIFELAVSLASPERSVVCIDEVENGIHHSSMESIWGWIAEASRFRDAQIFATTHSEECVQAACRAFAARGDEGLRVIRLDKQKRETKAVVYDRNLVEAASRMGVEIRG
ncbi:ATPase-like protein [Myxococcus stipitatus DSM 14675]|uniref:ATPase-like protein n=1 Tax=Myxococcus stipitatus (strain DSM 14675 / JCM 12634 / Mx s8) TaxID=1278073 RepID=L7UMR1_MYXSD|nr:ATP-binding protein [Myxococcus stipitatus]AGC49293.1 ATPase-like protein [Myxococcus stipitatus DSM 14675]